MSERARAPVAAIMAEWSKMKELRQELGVVIKVMRLSFHAFAQMSRVHCGARRLC